MVVISYPVCGAIVFPPPWQRNMAQSGLIRPHPLAWTTRPDTGLGGGLSSYYHEQPQTVTAPPLVNWKIEFFFCTTAKSPVYLVYYFVIRYLQQESKAYLPLSFSNSKIDCFCLNKDICVKSLIFHIISIIPRGIPFSINYFRKGKRLLRVKCCTSWNYCSTSSIS